MILGSTLSAQTWPTFYSAYEDGLDAQKRGDLASALRAFAYAAQKRPEPGGRVKTYGNNFMSAYYPYLKQAECALALADLDRTERALQESAKWPQEPAAAREGLMQRLRQARAAREAAQKPVRTEPAPEPVRPAPKPVEAPVKALEPAPKPIEPVLRPPEPRPAPVETAKAAPPRPEPVRKEAVPVAPVAATPTPTVAAAPPKLEPKTLPPANERAAPPAPSESPIKPLWMAGSGAALAALGGLWLVLRRRRKSAGGSPSTLTNPYKVDLETHQKGAPTVLSSAKGEAPKSRKVGPYVIKKVLGKGGCATTFLAVNESDGTEVAVKIPHPHIIIDPEFLARFRREAALGSVLDHPRIVRIVDPGPVDGEAWIAMTLVRGTTLDAHLAERNNRLALPEIIHITSDIAEAIAHAHNKGVVHRDLKPSNVMLGEFGAQVMDFGIARVLDTNMTSTTVFIGTPSYAAPESLANPRVGPPADRYALGILIFEMLAGRLPFMGETTFQILEMHKSAPLPDLKAMRPDTPPKLLRLVERLTAKRPEERPEDGEVLTILAALKTEFPMA